MEALQAMRVINSSTLQISTQLALISKKSSTMEYVSNLAHKLIQQLSIACQLRLSQTAIVLLLKVTSMNLNMSQAIASQLQLTLSLKVPRMDGTMLLSNLKRARPVKLSMMYLSQRQLFTLVLDLDSFIARFTSMQ